MPILGAVIVPHPPLIIPAVGRGEERGIQATVDAYRKAARLVASWQPEVLIVTTPQLVMYSDYFRVKHLICSTGYTADCRIQAGAVPAAGQDPDSSFHSFLPLSDITIKRIYEPI